ncbi:hypothetical protein G7048_03515 [Diaphorobacter sp. HDW4B]|uniref:hypothetical protein n=1 Tax=Diaphorobacter sp. HDW4B TaxID=2714925 RepID=UPI00140A6C0A|nr:hypothetical protein [Diaphorobacter sp. HDW4B]QIL69522.1 hypothetical protein G7048_03515 [Diaphorobacter sp. HDW4B]
MSNTPPVRRNFIELRTGDVLEVAGVRIQMEYKKGQVARMVVSAAPDTPIKKVAAVARPVPSLPS